MKAAHIPIATAVAGMILALAIVTVGQAGKSDVYDSDHDLGSPGNPACAQCHIPHHAFGSYLWSRVPSGAMEGLGSFCFSCHDGSVADAGYFIPDPAYETHPVNPGLGLQDCDRCHDPHEGDNWRFAADFIAETKRNANFCAYCHSQDGDGHPPFTDCMSCHNMHGDIYRNMTGAISHDIDVLTDLPQDRTWDPYDVPADLVGTRLWDEPGLSVVASGEGYVKCETCHTAHGGVGGSQLNTMAYRDADSSYSPICDNCHE